MASNEIRRGAAEMSMAMLMSGTIGWLVVSSQQSPFNVVFFRCIFGGATLALVCAVLGLFRRKLFSWKMLGLALLGGAAIVINWLLLFAAYSRASISMATAVYNTQPFMLVALGALVFRERISASTVVWLVVAFVGLVFVVKVEPAVLAVPGHYLAGVAYAVGAAAMYAISSIITKRLKGTPPHLIALIQVSLGVVMLAPFVRFDALPASGVQWLELIVRRRQYGTHVRTALWGNPETADLDDRCVVVHLSGGGDHCRPGCVRAEARVDSGARRGADPARGGRRESRLADRAAKTLVLNLTR